MRLVKVLLPVNQHGTTESSAALAFGLAGRSGAAVEVLHAYPSPADRLPYATELSPAYFEELIDVGKKQVELEQRQAHSWFTALSQRLPNVRAAFLPIEGPVTHSVATRAKAADFAVLPAIGAHEDLFFALARDAALFNSGRPIIVVPEDARGVEASSVVVAWKDTVEAARALAAARPFLAAAKQIKLVSVAEYQNRDDTLAMMADYLKQSGLGVELETAAAHGKDVGEVLVDLSDGENRLLVMGAYGHWRWREYVLGGATRHVLRHAKVPVLMSH
ncbi:universal stress protein [Methyloceanibacter sp.]|uniref:universal stress protein n=1 Tax=Methyloceanibacter sp. TaxID=1965321 RepID=UPI002D512CA1|nr:universal stress protein [Methyloceanibacter sp.]HZP09614.1 universal stress protein [Methyloceanibacter sp.]